MRRPDERALREELARICQRTYQAGLVAATDGNASCRISASTFLITPSGSALGELSADDFLRVDTGGQLLDRTTNKRPTMELAMHLAIYEERPEVNAVLHAHPPFTVAFSIAGHPPQEVREQLWERHRIMCRTISNPPSVRLSIHIFNTQDELEVVLQTVEALAQEPPTETRE